MSLKSIYWTLSLFIYIFNNGESAENTPEETIISSEQNAKNHTSLEPEHRIADSGDFNQISRIQSNYKEKQPGSYDENSEMDEDQIENAVKFGLDMVDELTRIKEPKWFKMGLYLDENHPANKVAQFGKPNKRAIELSKFGLATLEASRKIMNSFPSNLSRQIDDFPSSFQSRLLQAECPLKGLPICTRASKRYRTADGTCNNMERLWKGSTMQPMQRFLLPIYDDGIQESRRSVAGRPLPSARRISQFIHREKNVETKSLTLMFMQWGQFIDHDVTSTVKSRSFNGTVPRCCDLGGQEMLPEELTHPACLPIEIPPEDWLFREFGLKCMEFIRSAPSTRINCDFGWREQINQVTSFIDGSTIYGSDVETSDSIRTFRNGKISYGPLESANGREMCTSGALTTDCFEPGDGRASEQPGLIAIHTVFVRFHNQVAAVLSRFNTHWSDEKIFQETRKIIYSIVQHITYREFLPLVVGQEVMDLFELKLKNKGFYKGYDDRVNPAVANSFSTAAFRFGHSMVQNTFIRTDSDHRPIPNNVPLHEDFDNLENIWAKGSVDRILLGFCNQMSQRRDEFVCEELSNRLFQPKGGPFGMDLPAINIQRGRDHGLPSYTAWRTPCGLTPIEDWRDLEKVFRMETVKRFKAVYRHVNDIDLYSGGLAEKPVRGGAVGPTFSCIIAQQFLNLRKGDRFWYENGGLESSFTSKQLQQIRRVTLARIMCETMPSIKTIQPYVFLAAETFKNARLPCDSALIEDFDLIPWIEQPPDSTRKRFDFFRFLRRTSRSTKEKTKRKSSNNQKQTNKNRKTTNSTQIEKSSYSQPSLPNNIYHRDYSNKPKGSNQINISISSSATPLPHPIQIKIKIENGGSTTERYSSTVAKRKKPASYDRPNINIANSNTRPVSSINNLKPGNSYGQLSVQTPSTKPQYSYSVVASSKPLPHSHSKPVNSYNSNSVQVVPQRPFDDTYTKPSHFYGGVATSDYTISHNVKPINKPVQSNSYQQFGSTGFDGIFNDGYSKPLQRPSSDTYTRPSSFYELVGTSGYTSNGNRKPIKQTGSYQGVGHQDFSNGVVQIFSDGSYSSGSVTPVKPSSAYHNGYGSENSYYDEVDLEDHSFISHHDKYASNKYRPVDIMSDLYAELEDEYSSAIDIPKKPSFGQYYSNTKLSSINDPNRRLYPIDSVHKQTDIKTDDKLVFHTDLFRVRKNKILGNRTEGLNLIEPFTKMSNKVEESILDHQRMAEDQDISDGTENRTESVDVGETYWMVYNNSQKAALQETISDRNEEGEDYAHELPKPLVILNSSTSKNSSKTCS